jgi:hypothetical protein
MIFLQGATLFSLGLVVPVQKPVHPSDSSAVALTVQGNRLQQPRPAPCVTKVRTRSYLYMVRNKKPTQDAELPAYIEGTENLSGPCNTKIKHDAALRRGEKEDLNMTPPIAVPNPRHPDLAQLQNDWEAILRDAGLPPEPTPIRNATTLPKDPETPTKKNFFDRYSYDIFEAKQQWKSVGVRKIHCLFCDYPFWDRAGTNCCCPNHRKRHNEGKVYTKVMCATPGCTRQVYWFMVREKETLCDHCAWKRDVAKDAGFASHEAYLEFCNQKARELEETRKQQWNRLMEIYHE